MSDRVMRRADRHGSAIDFDAAGRESIGPEDRSYELGPPGPDQSGNPDDLAGTNLKVDPV
jgi:hypothetical protein